MQDSTANEIAQLITWLSIVYSVLINLDRYLSSDRTNTSVQGSEFILLERENVVVY
jgi:hypothetical protein